MTRTTICLAVGLGLMCAATLEGRGSGVTATAPVAAVKVRVGTYDPRAIAVAYAASAEHQAAMKPLTDEYEKARAAKDEKKIAELKQRGEAMQRRLHRQGFGGAPVDDILEKVADRLPEVTRVMAVSVVTRKVDYAEPGVETVDVTDEIVRLFEPSAKTLKTIEELRKTRPIDLDVLEKAEKNGKI